MIAISNVICITKSATLNIDRLIVAFDLVFVRMAVFVTGSQPIVETIGQIPNQIIGMKSEEAGLVTVTDLTTVIAAVGLTGAEHVLDPIPRGALQSSTSPIRGKCQGADHLGSPTGGQAQRVQTPPNHWTQYR